ncbi:MAG: NAD(P)H-dependent oxidoreductase [Gammaproteobacteria bacterium]|nr:NAD(P)H-dependent oxidoreductase [Gammaproteobacteria bacterium]
MSRSHLPQIDKPLILGIGGTTRSGSSSERAMRYVLARARELGAETEFLTGPQLVLPIYVPEDAGRDPGVRRLVESLRRANGLVVASPGYHGSLSGLIKNALDYAEDLRNDSPPYLEDRAVGLISCATGWQATGATLAALRSIVHALRGWPTPLGVAINTSDCRFDEENRPSVAAVEQQLATLAAQVVRFAERRAAHERLTRADAVRSG